MCDATWHLLHLLNSVPLSFSPRLLPPRPTNSTSVASLSVSPSLSANPRSPNPFQISATAMEDVHKSMSSSSSAIRFLGVLKQPDTDHNTPFELDEIDVVWSSATTPSDSSDSPDTDNSRESFSPLQSTDNNSTSNPHHSFCPGKFGLSAALSVEPAQLLQRKPSFNPSISAATAARTIPPVPIPRSDESSGLGSGKFHQSAPVDVPIWPKGNSSPGSEKLGIFDEDDEEMEDEMLPPHEIVARSQRATFSVFEGLGRTLKGRDLRRVRNAVWQKTGFLD